MADSEGLAKIATYTGQIGRRSDVKAYSNFKALFISDPDTAEKESVEVRAMMGGSDEQLVQRLMSRQISALESFTEIFSTHPNIVKRLRALAS